MIQEKSQNLPFPKDCDGNYIIFKTRQGNSLGGRTGSKTHKDAYIYLIKIIGHDLYKIGVSNSPSRRLHDIDSYLPFDFEILSLHFFTDVYLLEKSLMNKYLKHKVKREWFNLSIDQAKEIMIYLNDNCDK